MQGALSMPRLAAFPKGFLDALCVERTMTLAEWIDLAATLDIDGLEFYAGFPELADRAHWPAIRAQLASHDLAMPMLCCSPDFTHPDPSFRAQEIAKEIGWIELTAGLGGQFCRVLSGQRRPEVAVDDGLRFAAESIQACLPAAKQHNVTLILENHYKDNYWTWPELAQPAELFCRLVAMIDSPSFGVNFDPSNTLLAGEDPLDLLERVKDRVVTMHASDRYLAEGTLADLRREENAAGYAARLRHGVIGRGLNDYDAIFRTLADVGFDGWISIEDGLGFDELRESVTFLRAKMRQFWPR